MIIVHISTAITGGAGIATYRLHESLLQNIPDVESHVVQSQPLRGNLLRNVHQCTHFHPLPYRIKKKCGLLPYCSDLERYQKKIFSQPTNFDIISLPFSYYPIHRAPIVLDADIIHLHWTCGFLDYKSFFQNIKQPIVWTLHDIYPFMGLYHFKGDKNKNVNTELKQVDDKILRYKQEAVRQKRDINIVCPSKWMYNQSVNSEMFNGYDHTVISNCFDIDSFIPKERNKARQILGFNNSKKTIFFGADHINLYGKGMDLLVSALKEIPKDSYNLVTVGRGDVADIGSNLTSNYKHFGFVQNLDLLNLIYSIADFTIIPSREDNLPSMMIESMLNGTPVISFTNGGMAEHISTGTNGVLVEEMTADCLAKNIKDCLDDKYIFDAEMIRAYAVEQFNSQKIANSYYDLYKSILSR